MSEENNGITESMTDRLEVIDVFLYCAGECMGYDEKFCRVIYECIKEKYKEVVNSQQKLEKLHELVLKVEKINIEMDDAVNCLISIRKRNRLEDAHDALIKELCSFFTGLPQLAELSRPNYS